MLRYGPLLFFSTCLTGSQLLNDSVFLLQLLLELVLDSPILRIVGILGVSLGLRHGALMLGDNLVQLVQGITTTG